MLNLGGKWVKQIRKVIKTATSSELWEGTLGLKICHLPKSYLRLLLNQHINFQSLRSNWTRDIRGPNLKNKKKFDQEITL